MKNNKILVCLILALVFTVQGFVLAELNEKYIWVFSTDDTTITYDKETVKIGKDYSTNTSYVEAWAKYEYLPQGSINLVNRAKQIGAYFNGMENVQYILYHQCYASDTGFSPYGGIAHAKKIKILQTIYCDAEGQVIKQSNEKAFTDVEWIDIPEYISTRSGPEMLFDAVTAYAKKQEKASTKRYIIP